MSQKPADVVNAIESALGLEQGEGRAIYNRLVPTIQIANTRNPFDSDAQVRRAAGGGATDPATVAQFSSVSLLNPIGSGVDIQVAETIVSFEAQPQTMDMGIVTAAALAGSSDTDQSFFLDTRLRGRPAGRIVILTAAVLNINLVGTLFTAASLPTPVRLPILLAPGTAFIGRTDAVNTGATMSFSWFEQPVSQL